MAAITHIDRKATYSEAVVHAGTVYLSGQVPWKTARTGTFREQADEVFGLVDAALATAGSSKGRVLSMQVFLKDPANYSEMNAAFLAWLGGGVAPARNTICGITFPNPDWQLEVVCVAATNL